MKELKEALAWNYDKGLDAQSAGDMTEMIMKAMQKAGRNVDASTAEGLLKTFMGMKPGEQKTQRFKEIHDMIDEVPKFGNDIPEVDYFAREVAYTYSKPLQKYNNPRGGKFQQSVSCICKCTAGRTDRSDAGWKICTHTCCRRRFAICGQGCKGTYGSGNFRIQTGSFYCIQRNTL